MANLNLNKVTLGGRLTSDITLKQTPQGTSVCSFIIAVNRKGKDAQTDFINCVAWKNQAETISKYFKKGSSICVSGAINQRTYTDKNNEKRSLYEVVVDEVYFVDSKSDNAEPEPKYEEIKVDSDLPF